MKEEPSLLSEQQPLMRYLLLEGDENRTGTRSNVLHHNHYHSYQNGSSESEESIVPVSVYLTKGLSVHGKSSKLYNKHFTSLPQIGGVAHGKDCNCFVERGDNTTDSKWLHRSAISGDQFFYFGRREVDLSLLNDFTGFPEVRTNKPEVSKNRNCGRIVASYKHNASNSNNRNPSQLYRVPKLLEEAFQPDVQTSYSYKCSVRTNQNVLSPQTVTISLLSSGRSGSGDKAEGHFALAPLQSPLKSGSGE